MDWETEYARRYHHAPRADQRWHQVLAYLERIPRFDARDLLHQVQASGMAEGLKAGTGETQMVYAKLERTAWPS